MTLDPRARKVLDLAYDEARQLNNNHIGTEHLLLGLIREGDGLAARILSKLGVDLLSARREVIAYLGGDVATAPQRQRSKTPTLDEFGRDLTQLAREDKLDPVVGRYKEIERVIQILSRRTKNNPCLIGEPGVGKTAVAEVWPSGSSVATSRPLKDKRVVSLDLAGLVAGTKYRGEFEERMKRVMEIRRAQGESSSLWMSCTPWWAPAPPRAPSTPRTFSSQRWRARAAVHRRDAMMSTKSSSAMVLWPAASSR